MGNRNLGAWIVAAGLSSLAGCATAPGPQGDGLQGDGHHGRPAEQTLPKLSEEPRPPLELDSGETLRRIGFGSCLHQNRAQPILEKVRQDDFDVFLFLGDNVYGDVEVPEDLRELREAYAKQARSKGLERLRASVPILAVWDDHDYGLNDAGAEFSGREGAKRLFEEFWRIPPSSPRTQRPGIYDSVLVGPPGKRVQILLLDTRFFRSPLKRTDEPGKPGKERYLPDPDPKKTLLGQAQWRWLEEELEKPAELRLLVSSIQVIAEGHGWEAWRTLPTERERLYTVLRDSKANGVIILSGDRHRAGIYRHDEALGYPLYEITSSSLNLPIAGTEEEPGSRRLGPTYRDENYGSLAIDWARGEVGLEIRGMEGQKVLEETVPLASLLP